MTPIDAPRRKESENHRTFMFGCIVTELCLVMIYVNWGNWGKWGNWGIWGNWGNWGNWGKWGKWGKWGNSSGKV